MSHTVLPFMANIAKLLIALVLLQFVGANLGAHQLHVGNSNEEQNNHPHLQFTTEVISLAECADCACALDGSSLHSVNDDHQHFDTITDFEKVDVCLDCQCHGGHVALAKLNDNVVSEHFHDLFADTKLNYLPPESFPTYRPPIV
ncbi:MULTISPECIES: hypothetical protein [unclassified Shewanella]|uniref:hypothetical protein n=2 Tax=Shewanella TaxID=22 RepID=UPI00287374CF|nr:hypothetical protein [Shewanella sp. SR44-4]